MSHQHVRHPILVGPRLDHLALCYDVGRVTLVGAVSIAQGKQGSIGQELCTTAATLCWTKDAVHCSMPSHLVCSASTREQPACVVMSRLECDLNSGPCTEPYKEKSPDGRSRTRPNEDLRRSGGRIWRCGRYGSTRPHQPRSEGLAPRSGQETSHRERTSFDGVAIRQRQSRCAPARPALPHFQRVHHPQAALWSRLREIQALAQLYR